MSDNLVESFVSYAVSGLPVSDILDIVESSAISPRSVLDRLVEGVPDWVKKAARTEHKFAGPNGNHVVAYRWIAKQDSPFDKPTSDWDNAETCYYCRRSIVYVYWVELGDKTIEPFGGDHLDIALGFNHSLSQAMLNKIARSVKNDEGKFGKSSAVDNRVQKLIADKSAESARDLFQKARAGYATWIRDDSSVRRAIKLGLWWLKGDLMMLVDVKKMEAKRLIELGWKQATEHDFDAIWRKVAMHFSTVKPKVAPEP